MRKIRPSLSLVLRVHLNYESLYDLRKKERFKENVALLIYTARKQTFVISKQEKRDRESITE